MVTNWAGNITFSAPRVERPTDVDELRRIVSSYAHVHAVGTGHSFSPVADTRGLLVSVADSVILCFLREISERDTL